MKKLLLIFCFCSSFFGFTQEHQEFYSRPFVIFEGCEDAKDKVECYDISLQELIGRRLNTIAFKDSIFAKTKKDTISVPVSILYDEKGFIVKDYSNIYSPTNGKSTTLKSLLDTVPRVQPVLDLHNHGVASTVTNLFGYFLDRSKNSITPILGYQPTEVPFSIIEQVPIYKGCDKNLSNIELKDCMSEKVTELVSRNFNTRLAKKLGLPNGIIRIYVSFKIDKKGKVTDVKARGPHKELENEAIRVINKIPKLKAPGIQRGKPVVVPYALPIVFRVTN